MADKIKKLSEAIRLGATFRPQCHGQLFNSDGKSCALGAAIEALGIGEPEFFIHDEEADGLLCGELVERFPHLRAMSFYPINICDGATDYLDLVIMQLNDSFMWTREQISDWLQAQGL